MGERQLCKLDVESSSLFISTNTEPSNWAEKGQPLQHAGACAGSWLCVGSAGRRRPSAHLKSKQNPEVSRMRRVEQGALLSGVAEKFLGLYLPGGEAAKGKRPRLL